MKPHILLLPLSLSLAACTPANNSTQASSESSAMSAESVAEAPAVVAVDDSVSSSAASVVVHTTEIYDAPTIQKVAARPGYWQIAHLDPQTHKRYVTKVCIDRDLANRMSADHPQPPAGWHGGKPDASFLGACPSTLHGGDVINHDGSVKNAWGDHRDDHGRPGGRQPSAPGPIHTGGSGNGHHDGGHSSSSSSQGHRPPGDGGAPGRPDSHMGQGASSSSRDHRDGRSHNP